MKILISMKTSIDQIKHINKKGLAVCFFVYLFFAVARFLILSAEPRSVSLPREIHFILLARPRERENEWEVWDSIT